MRRNPSKGSKRRKPSNSPSGRVPAKDPGVWGQFSIVAKMGPKAGNAEIVRLRKAARAQANASRYQVNPNLPRKKA